MSIVRQERLLWTTLGLATGAASFLDVRKRVFNRARRSPVAARKQRGFITRACDPPRRRAGRPSPRVATDPDLPRPTCSSRRAPSWSSTSASSRTRFRVRPPPPSRFLYPSSSTPSRSAGTLSCRGGRRPSRRRRRSWPIARFADTLPTSRHQAGPPVFGARADVTHRPLLEQRRRPRVRPPREVPQRTQPLIVASILRRATPSRSRVAASTTMYHAASATAVAAHRAAPIAPSAPRGPFPPARFVAREPSPPRPRRRITRLRIQLDDAARRRALPSGPWKVIPGGVVAPAGSRRRRTRLVFARRGDARIARSSSPTSRLSSTRRFTTNVFAKSANGVVLPRDRGGVGAAARVDFV